MASDHDASDVRPDLTPMIDIVFNLIIFFMIVSELSNLTVEQLQLAYASEAKPPEPAAEKVLQLNVLERGPIKVRGNPFGVDPAGAGRYPPLADFLALEAAAAPREASLPSGGLPPSRLRVTLRADKEAPFRRVLGVLDACDDQGIYRTSFAASPDAPQEDRHGP